MRKYIDKDKVLEYIIFGVVGKDITCGELTRAIESIPTIEVSDKADRPFEYFEGYEDGRKSVEVSEDCVSREWLFKNYQAVCATVTCSACPFDDDGGNYCRLADFVMNAPSVVPRRAEGEWIIDEPEESGYGTIYECPYCKYEVEFEPTNYCPNCGAKMKGAE